MGEPPAAEIVRKGGELKDLALVPARTYFCHPHTSRILSTARPEHTEEGPLLVHASDLQELIRRRRV